LAAERELGDLHSAFIPSSQVQLYGTHLQNDSVTSAAITTHSWIQVFVDFAQKRCVVVCFEDLQRLPVDAKPWAEVE
jgi:hypothetical protein